MEGPKEALTRQAHGWDPALGSPVPSRSARSGQSPGQAPGGRLFGLVASGQIRLRKIDGYTKIATVLSTRARPAA